MFKETSVLLIEVSSNVMISLDMEGHLLFFPLLKDAPKKPAEDIAAKTQLITTVNLKTVVFY